jgi:hypothetical protein
VSLNMLRSRRSKREEPLGVHVPDPIVSSEDGLQPEHEALLADTVGLALLVVLETLNPGERLAYVLNDMFAIPFDDIAPDRRALARGDAPACFSPLRGGGGLVGRRKDLVARDEPVAHLDHGSDVHRVEKLIRCDLAVAHQQGRDKAVMCASFKRGQRHRPLLAVGLSMLGGKPACAVLAFEDSAVGEFDHGIIGRQGCCCVSVRCRGCVHVSPYDVFGGGHRSIVSDPESGSCSPCEANVRERKCHRAPAPPT